MLVSNGKVSIFHAILEKKLEEGHKKIQDIYNNELGK